jgi:hypothetical protein
MARLASFTLFLHFMLSGNSITVICQDTRVAFRQPVLVYQDNQIDSTCLIIRLTKGDSCHVSFLNTKETFKSAEAFEIFIDSIAARINPDKVFMGGSPALHKGLFDAVLKTLAAHGILHFKMVHN